MSDKNRLSFKDYVPDKYILPGPKITMTRSVITSLILIVSMYFGFIPKELAVNDLGSRFIVDMSQLIFYLSLTYSLYLSFWILLCILIIKKNLDYFLILDEPEETLRFRRK